MTTKTELFKKFEEKKREQLKVVFIWIVVTIAGAIISYIVSEFFQNQKNLYNSIQFLHTKIERLVHPNSSGILSEKLFNCETDFGLTREQEKLLDEIKRLLGDLRSDNQSEKQYQEELLDKLREFEKSIIFFKTKLEKDK